MTAKKTPLELRAKNKAGPLVAEWGTKHATVRVEIGRDKPRPFDAEHAEMFCGLVVDLAAMFKVAEDDIWKMIETQRKLPRSPATDYSD